MVLTPAKQLLANGNLANSGTTIALRILRDGCSLTNYQAPYWFDYLGPVFYFLPFIILFGSNTVLPFAFGQLFLLLTLIGLLIFFTRKKPLFFNLLLISLFTCTSLDGIFWNAPNSLQFLIFLSIVFFNLRVFINRPYTLGLLLGCSFQFRPETLFLIPASFLYYFLIRKNNLKNTFIFIGKTILTMSLVVFCFLLIRNLLGGTSSQDHKLYVLATNVLKPDFGVLFGYEVFSFSDLLTKESLFSFFNKVYIGFTKLLTFKHHFWLRKDIWIYAFLIIMSCFKGHHKKVFAELTFIVFIVFFGILLSFIGCDAPKYYDMHLFMISLFFIKRSEIIFNDFNSNYFIF